MSKSVSQLRKFFFKGQWRGGGEESACGGGSTMEATQYIRAALPEFLSKHDVRVFLDAPCGDFAWMKAVDLDGIYYIGMDIVEEFIHENRLKFGSANRKFLAGDISVDLIPPADVMMVRECLFHLPFEHIFNFFENFIRSDIPLLLMTTQFPRENVDLERPGRYRALNMCSAPFNLPEPRERLRDYLPGKGERYMALWTKQDVEAAVRGRH